MKRFGSIDGKTYCEAFDLSIYQLALSIYQLGLDLFRVRRFYRLKLLQPIKDF